MSEVGNLYDNGPISPIVKIKENMSIWSGGIWHHYKADFIEPVPRSSPMVVEMVVATGNTFMAANGIIARAVVGILQLAELEFLHLRWEPLDDVEGILWEQSSQGRYAPRSVQARVTPFTAARDPNLATTTFFILGMNRDMNLEVRNPRPVIQTVARFVFWGYRYLLEPVGAEPKPTTWVPAEGKQIRS